MKAPHIHRLPSGINGTYDAFKEHFNRGMLNDPQDLASLRRIADGYGDSEFVKTLTEYVEYKSLFEKPLDEIKEDIFFRADNFENEKWYDDLQTYMSIGICEPNRDSVNDLQKALKVLGYSAHTKEHNGKLFLVPQRETPKQPPKQSKGHDVYDDR